MEITIGSHDVSWVEMLLVAFVVLTVWLAWRLHNALEELRLLKQRVDKAEYWEGDAQSKYEKLRRGLSYRLTAATGEVCGTELSDSYFLLGVEEALADQKRWREAVSAKAPWTDLLPRDVNREDPEQTPDDET